MEKKRRPMMSKLSANEVSIVTADSGLLSGGEVLDLEGFLDGVVVANPMER